MFDKPGLLMWLLIILRDVVRVGYVLASELIDAVVYHVQRRQRARTQQQLDQELRDWLAVPARPGQWIDE